MGLFSSTYTTTVGTTVARVIADDALPESVKTGVINAIFEKGQVDEHILENLVSGVGIRAGRMYEYGKKHYSYGLPSSTLVNSGEGASGVLALMKTLHGANTTLEYSQFGPLNLLHYGWHTLEHSHGYNPVTNVLGTLSAAKGFTVYLKDMVVVVTEASMAERANGSLDSWGTPPAMGNNPCRAAGIAPIASSFETNSKAAGDYLRISFQWKNAAGVVQEGSFNMAVAGYVVKADYFQARYVSATGTGYWIYKQGSGTYPSLDRIFDPSYDGLGSFFPVAYFRYNKTSMAANPASQEYKTSKKLVKYLGIDYASMIASIHENPDIDQVEQAMLMMAVLANTTNPLEQRYLFDFFRTLSLESGAVASYSNPTGYAIAQQLEYATPYIGMVIQDARFKTSVSCESMFRGIKVGGIAPLNGYTSGMGSVPVTETAKDSETGAETSWISSRSYHYYRHQVTATLYEEVRVFGLRTTYHIYGQYTAIGDETDAILLIPLDSSITDAYSISDKETLYARSLHYVFNSRVVTKVKWYQQEWFSFVLIVAAVVITIVTYGAAWQSTAAAVVAGTMTTTALATAIAMGVFKYLVFSLAIKLFISVVGVKFAFLVAVVAATYGVYTAIEAGSIAGAPWAQELLQLSSNLSNAVSDSYTAAIKGLQKEAEAFGLYIEDKTKELTDANTLLNASSVLSPFVVFGESPDEFFNRTTHSGNIGIVGIEAVSSYVGLSLTLPKLTDTLQGANYGNI